MLRQTTQKTLLPGDFNAHHSEWPGKNADREPKAEHLRAQLAQRGLELLNKKGVPTWKRGDSESVLDLRFATANLRGRLISFLPRDEWAPTRDHIPIKIRMDLPPPPQRSSKRFTLKKAKCNSKIMRIREGQWREFEPQHRLQALTETDEQALTDFCPKQSPKNKPRHA